MDSKWIVPLGFAATLGVASLFTMNEKYLNGVRQEVIRVANSREYGNNDLVLDPVELNGIATDLGGIYVESIDDLTLSQKKVYLQMHED